jgi:hypothetical protein
MDGLTYAATPVFCAANWKNGGLLYRLDFGGEVDFDSIGLVMSPDPKNYIAQHSTLTELPYTDAVQTAGHIFLAIDMPVIENGSFMADTANSGDTITIAGWATNGAVSVANCIIVQAGDTYYMSSTGFARPDVADYLGNASLKNCGFSVDIPASSLSGTDSINLYIYYASYDNFEVFSYPIDLK